MLKINHDVYGTQIFKSLSQGGTRRAERKGGRKDRGTGGGRERERERETGRKERWTGEREKERNREKRD